MPTLAILLFTSQPWLRTAIQVLTVVAALSLGVVLIWLCFRFVWDIYHTHWKFTQTRRLLHLHNTGNVRGIFRLQAQAPQNALTFRFLNKTDELNWTHLIKEEDQPKPPFDFAYYVETPEVKPDEHLSLELLIEPRNLYCSPDYGFCVRSYQVEQPDHPNPEGQRVIQIDQVIHFSGVARLQRTLKAFLAALTILVFIAALAAVGLLGSMLVAVADKL